jgi:hypothetical protein
MTAQMKQLIDSTASLWLKGKPAGVFTSTGSTHGGQETTLLTMMVPLLHLGMVIVGVPYYTDGMLHTKARGGTPYGATTIAGPRGELQPTKKILGSRVLLANESPRLPRSSAQKFTMLRTDSVMSYSISILLTRNLQEVFGETDPTRRRAAIEEIFTEDCVFYEPKGVHSGRDEIDRIAGAIRVTHPDFQYQPIADPEELGNGGRIKWVSGRPGEPPAYAGTDFIIAREGRIAAVYLFFDKLP